ncbi:2,5-diamino-6-(ribosylamino)-4(3H)-pyrimidinone 5'-phosphate reductase [Anaerolineales bacterium]|nr:2,5-diamino-6-(ribosylamino)-4(3H)-pyrimidinone 5'-phosphate reductase [Anaerolineales bacterium]
MNRPYTFVNVAMTADGKIDTFERRGAAISSKRDKQRVDELRAAADGILVGGKTLLEESPKLTVKSEALREDRISRGLSPNPIKVGVVTVADIPLESDFIQTGDARVVIFTTSRTSKSQIETLRAHGLEVIFDDAPRVDLNKMMLTLKKIGVDHLMVEGGGTMNFELIRLGLVDEIMLYIAPMIFGGANAPTLADGLGLTRNDAVALKLENVETHDDGGIVLRYKLQGRV